MKRTILCSLPGRPEEPTLWMNAAIRILTPGNWYASMATDSQVSRVRL